MDSHLLEIAPLDDHNLMLLAKVRPRGWTNPEPARRYNLVVVGAGTAGLVSAVGAAGLGAKVAIIERDLMGGDCLNFGCVPSKALIASARTIARVRGANEFGIEVPLGARADFAQAAARMREIRASIAHNDSAERLRNLGIDVYLGAGKFVANDAVEVDGKRLTFRRAAIATGARAAVPPIPGLAETGYLTNETVFSMTELPARLAIIGGGPIGCELAQALIRLGAEV
ncbi:MAG: FAD-dependent oxidoreductase, partial [Pseudomonadota bacterium]